MAKPGRKFFDTDSIAWQPVEGQPGSYEKILSMDPDTGDYVRLTKVRGRLWVATD